MINEDFDHIKERSFCFNAPLLFWFISSVWKWIFYVSDILYWVAVVVGFYDRQMASVKLARDSFLFWNIRYLISTLLVSSTRSIFGSYFKASYLYSNQANKSFLVVQQLLRVWRISNGVWDSFLSINILMNSWNHIYQQQQKLQW